jgi:hypothetical protein
MRIASKVIVVFSIFAWVFTGCAIGTRIKSPPAASRSDVFREVADAQPLPAGAADVEIMVSVKTPYAAYFLLGSRDIPYGTEEYPFLLNIDGQAIEWKVAGIEDTKPVRLEDGSRAQEGGKGVVYVLKKKIRISPGSHAVFFSLPAEVVSTTMDITVKEKGIYSLVLQPIYEGGRRYPKGHFTRGVRGLHKTFSLVRVQCR